MNQEHLDSFKSKDEVLPIVAFFEGTHQDEGLHSGKGTGLLKWTVGVQEDGRPKTRSMCVYSDYKYIMRVINNRFALINMCSYFGRTRYEKNSEGKYKRVSTRVPSECFGLAIDLDYVKVKQLQRLFGKMECDLIPYPTYIVNSGAGLHLYYIFEKPIPLKDLQVQRYLGALKEMLTEIIWDNETSLCSMRQYTGIYQDMRVPGSWTKFGYKNKSRCKYILRAYKVGQKVDLMYLEEFVNKDNLPSIEEDGSSSKERLTLQECEIRYPKWYKRVVIDGELTRQLYTQNRGLFEWWKKIITQEKSVTGFETDKAHVGNRFFCMRALFVMAKKCDLSFEEAYEEAKAIMPFMDSLAKSESEAFTIEDVKDAAAYYEESYVKWSNKTLAKQTGIDVKLFITSEASKRRHREIVRENGKVGREQKEHLKRARHLRELATYENVGRPDKREMIRTWRESHPNGTKYACQKELGLSKNTIKKWWE